MDYFFAQIEERENPSLRNKPFAVGSRHIRRGVISTSNYIARKYGVHSALSNVIALKKCPDLMILPVRMDLYKKVSNTIREVFYSITDKVEPLSLDEAYIDVSNVIDFSNSATLIANHIKEEILRRTNLTASAGVAPNKLLAKIASDINKPNGMYVVKPNEVGEFIRNLSVKKLYGVGNVTAKKLKEMGIEYCHQLQRVSLSELTDNFGVMGSSLYYYSRGIDNREVKTDRCRKSIGIENTYLKNLETHEEWLLQIETLYDGLLSRIKEKHKNCIKSIFIKATDITFYKTSIERASSIYELKYFKHLSLELYLRQDKPVRLLGLGVRLSEGNNNQLDLFQMQ